MKSELNYAAISTFLIDSKTFGSAIRNQGVYFSGKCTISDARYSQSTYL